MAPTLFGKKTENCRTSGPPILEVVSGKSTCMFFEFRDKNSGREYLTVRLPFPTEFVPVNVCLVGSQAEKEFRERRFLNRPWLSSRLLTGRGDCQVAHLRETQTFGGLTAPALSQALPSRSQTPVWERLRS